MTTNDCILDLNGKYGNLMDNINVSPRSSVSVLQPLRTGIRWRWVAGGSILVVAIVVCVVVYVKCNYESQSYVRPERLSLARTNNQPTYAHLLQKANVLYNGNSPQPGAQQPGAQQPGAPQPGAPPQVAHAQAAQRDENFTSLTELLST